MRKIADFFEDARVKISFSATLLVIGAVLSALGFSMASFIAYLLSLLVSGFSVFSDAARGILRRDPFDEKLLMCIGAVGAMIIGEWGEGAAVMLFFIIGETFESRAVRKSRAHIKALMNIRPDEATVIRDGVEEVVDADEVEIGEELVIRAGERVPVDSVVLSGSANLDTSAITGEALPIYVEAESVIKSGTVVLDGILRARASQTADNSAAGRILELVESAADNKSKEEYFIAKFARYYTPIICLLAVFIATLPFAFGWLSLKDSVYRALVFLVFSCPCALVISVPMAFFAGIGCAASNGILYKGANGMSPLSRARTFVFDKTGTLTSGKFEISCVKAFGIRQEELLSLAAALEYGSTHPIAEAIKSSSDTDLKLDAYREIAGKGVYGEIGDKKYYLGNQRLMKDVGIDVPNAAEHGTAVYISTEKTLLGYIIISDSIKGEASSSLNSLRALGARRLLMLTGDSEAGAQRVAEAVGIDESYSRLLPEDKYKKLQDMIALGEGVVYTGDGINDAPSLALADIGIAMGAIGTDLAIETADVVIMSDSLDRIPKAVRIARRTVRIAKQNIAFALTLKFAVLVLGALGFANMWLAVFADVGVALLAILNATRALKCK